MGRRISFSAFHGGRVGCVRRPNMEAVMKLSIIGSGDWDTNLIILFADAPGVHRIYGSPDNSPWTEQGYVLTECLESILTESDAVVIASVPESRYKHISEALDHDCHVWIEPPFCSNAKDAYDLVRKANEKGKLLFINHPFCYSSMLSSFLPFGAERDIVKQVRASYRVKAPLLKAMLKSRMIALLVYLGLPLSKFELQVAKGVSLEICLFEVEYKNGFIFQWDIAKDSESCQIEARRAFLSAIETQDHFCRTDGEHGLEVMRIMEFLADNGL